MPKISLVVPVYGVEKYIHQFLDSVCGQTFRDFEAILVDDGSKDNCPQILDEYAARDNRFRVIHQSNGGVSSARNMGLSYATGQYIYIVDSDDWLELTALESLWNEAERTNADIIYGDYVSERNTPLFRHCFDKPFVTEDRETIRVLQFAVNANEFRLNISRPEFKAIVRMGGAPWRMMVKASIVRDNDLQFDPYVRGQGDDILFTLHLYEYVRKVAYTQSVVYHYRVVDGSYTHGFKSNYPETVARIFEKQEEFLREYNKDAYMYRSYYLRVLLYLRLGMPRYYKNIDNPKSEQERFREFVETVRQAPYKGAIRKAPIKCLDSRRLRVCNYFLRFGLYRVYWKLILKKEE